jgi:hypothetical protein
MTKTKKLSSRKKKGTMRRKNRSMKGRGIFTKNSWFYNKGKINIDGQNWNQLGTFSRKIYCHDKYQGSSTQKPGYHYYYDDINNKCAMLPTNPYNSSDSIREKVYDDAFKNLCKKKSPEYMKLISNRDCNDTSTSTIPMNALSNRALTQGPSQGSGYVPRATNPKPRVYGKNQFQYDTPRLAAGVSIASEDTIDRGVDSKGRAWENTVEL